jgi:hypothetical protein
MLDVRLGVGFIIDFLIKDNTTGRFRIHLSGNRLRKYCEDPDWDNMLGRMILATVKKLRLAALIHTDAIRIDNRVIRGCDDDRIRRKDVRDIHRTRAILDGIHFLHVRPIDYRLYPNTKATYTPFFDLGQMQKHKIECANRLRDVSIVWQCGYKRRNILRDAGIFSWDNPRFIPSLSMMVPSCYMNVIRRMIDMTQEMNHPFYIPSDLIHRFPFLADCKRPWVFVDFETDFHKCIYLFGEFSHRDGYRNEWSQNISLHSERDLMMRIHDRLCRLKEEGFLIGYFYAERSFWRERCKIQQLPLLQDVFDDAIDLHKLFLHGPIMIQGLFDFKLKHIAGAMFRHGLITLQQPDGCADGAESVRLAQQYFRTHDLSVRTIIENYNRFDCEVLDAMLRFIQNHVL